MQKKLSLWLLSVCLGLLQAGCGSDNPAEPEAVNPEELITRITLNLTPLDATGQPAGAAVVVRAVDREGDGKLDQIDTLRVKTATQYRGEVELFDGINNEDIGTEVAEEAEVHQFFFTAQGAAASRLSVSAADKESDYTTNTGTDHPVGLRFTLGVSAGGSGAAALNVVLSHFDEAPKNGKDRSDETDIDVSFPVVITN